MNPTSLPSPSATTRFQTLALPELNLFYREAGSPDAPTLLLLHGFPTSSHMFRHLLPQLADRYHLLAPDLPGFGFSDAPDRAGFDYTFEHLADVIAAFIEARSLQRFALYVFDYGAPIGWRLALRFPGRITAIITQNGNAYEAGLSEAWSPLRAYWSDPTPAHREALRTFLTTDLTRFQYHHGVADAANRIAPEAIALDQAFLDRPGNADIQLDLMRDYRNNLALYPAFHAYLRQHRPPVLATWGRHDPFFLPAGAEAFREDQPATRIVFYDTGHFALETHAAEIAAEIRQFLG